MIRILLMLVLATPAYAHEAPSGWAYDHACCHDQDCAPASQVVRNADGSLLLVTPLAAGRTGPSTRFLPSQDAKAHACIRPGSTNVICVYLPPET